MAVGEQHQCLLGRRTPRRVAPPPPNDLGGRVRDRSRPPRANRVRAAPRCSSRRASSGPDWARAHRPRSRSRPRLARSSSAQPSVALLAPAPCPRWAAGRASSRSVIVFAVVVDQFHATPLTLGARHRHQRGTGSRKTANSVAATSCPSSWLSVAGWAAASPSRQQHWRPALARALPTGRATPRSPPVPAVAPPARPWRRTLCHSDASRRLVWTQRANGTRSARSPIRTPVSLLDFPEWPQPGRTPPTRRGRPRPQPRRRGRRASPVQMPSSRFDASGRPPPASPSRNRATVAAACTGGGVHNSVSPGQP